MTLKVYKDKAHLKMSKDKTIKIGRRSINDIIKTEKLTFPEKIDYIRHHYTYYEGNAHLFDGEYEYRRKWLNKLIESVINRKHTASVLKKFNKVILKWRNDPDYQPSSDDLYERKPCMDLEKNPEFSKLFETDDATDTINEKLVYQTIKNTLKYYHYINDNYQSKRKQDAIAI